MAKETFSFEDALGEQPAKEQPPKARGRGTAKPEGTWDEDRASVKGKRSVVEDVGRQIGLTARAGINGLAAIPAMAADAVTGPINEGLDMVAGKGKGFRFQKAGVALDKLLTAAGVAEPENATERVVQDIASSMAGTGGTVKAGQAMASRGGTLAKGVGEALAAGPKLQVASAATGAGAAGGVREGGGGEGAQLAAGLVASLAPALAPAAGTEAVRRVLRGGEAGRKRVAENIATFEAAGVQPTLGQAAGGKLQRVEALVGKAPGGAGVVAEFANKQADDMAASVLRVSDQLAPGANAMQAGEAISSGIGAFKKGFKVVQEKLYANLDKHIPLDTRIGADRTRAALAELNSDIAGAPALSKWFKNARIQGIESGLTSDTGSVAAVLSRPGMKEKAAQLQAQLEEGAAKVQAANAERRQLGMANMEAVPTADDIAKQVNGFLTKQIDNSIPYESLKKLRTLVGREISDGGLVTDVPRSKWQSLYAALSDDLGVAAAKAGPEAEKSWRWANTYTKTQLERLDQLSSIVAKDAPEKVFNAAIAGTVEGDTIIKRVINALPKQERREVAAAVLQRMGRATIGQQNAMGDAFSSETFLSNLSKLSPASRKTIFGRTDVKGIEDQIGNFAKVAEMRREGGKIFANPSGTASTGAQLVNASALGAGLTASVATGNPLPLAAAAAPMVASNLGARALTNPKLAKFAADSTVLRPGTGATAGGAAARALSEPTMPGTDPTQSGTEPAPATPATFSFEEAMGGGDVPTDPAPGSQSTVPTPPQEAPPQPAFTSKARPDGTMAIAGDPVALRSLLQQAGIPAKSIATSREGLLIGRTQALRAQEVLDALGAAEQGNPAEEETAIESQPVSMQALETEQNQGLAPVDSAQAATETIANVQDPTQATGAGTETQTTPVETATAMASNAAPTQDLPGTGNPADLQPAGLTGEGGQFADAGAQTPLQAADTQPIASIDQTAHAAATSPMNDRPEPSEAQKRAGNYALGHDRIAGMNVSIENPQGSVRRGVDPDGQPWETEMQHHYGYFKGSTATDGDKLDVFIKPGTPKDYAGPVFVIDQVDPRTGKLDEHKTILGAVDENEAKEIYAANYAPGWKGMGSITRLPLSAFKAWAQSGSKKEPLGDLEAARAEQEQLAVDPQQQAMARIDRLREAGEDGVADLMQQDHERGQRKAAVPSELARMRDVAPDLAHHALPEFTKAYEQMRSAGVKPAEAAGRAGLLAAVAMRAPEIGMPEKAVAALQAQLQALPLEAAPSFAQRFTEGLIKRGVMQPFAGAGEVSAMLEQDRDGAMHAAVDAAYG